MTDKTFEAYSGLVNVKDYGATGNGVTDDTTAIQAAINAAYPVQAQDDPVFTSNKKVYLPNGNYSISSPLTIAGKKGVHICGASRFGTVIRSGGGIFAINSLDFSVFSDMYLKSNSGTIFDLNNDGAGTYHTALQSITFRDLFFDGTSGGASYGLKIAAGFPPAGGFMGSEMLVQNCFITQCSQAALYTGAANALNITVVGGNISFNNQYGIQVAAGSVNCYSVGFQSNPTADYFTGGNTNNTMVLSGCRTESAVFVSNTGCWMTIIGCVQNMQTAGYFLKQIGGNAHILDCRSVNGRVQAQQWGGVDVQGSSFGRSDWYEMAVGTVWGGYGTDGQPAGYIRAREVLAGGGEQVNQTLIQERDLNVCDQFGGTPRRITSGYTATATSDPTFLYNGPFRLVTISNASPGVVTLSDNKIAANTAVVFAAGSGTLPGTLTAGTTYFIKTVSTNDTFTVSATSGGTAINTSGGTGTVKMALARPWAVGDEVRNTSVVAGGSPGWICTTPGYMTTGGGAVFKATANVAA